MINSRLINVSTITAPGDAGRVFTSTSTGARVGISGATGQTRAITTIVLCNVLTPDPAGDEAVNSCNVNIYVVSADPAPDFGSGIGSSTLLVSNLPVPAGETVFFAEERLVLEPGDAIFVGTSTANAICVTVSSLQV
jgi:hypothetical protein